MAALAVSEALVALEDAAALAALAALEVLERLAAEVDDLVALAAVDLADLVDADYLVDLDGALGAEGDAAAYFVQRLSLLHEQH